MYLVSCILYLVGGFPVSLSFDLFDKLIVPILWYGSEVWGTKHILIESIEIVHTNFCKYILSVSYNASHAAVLDDLGRTPLYVLYKYRCVKCWLNIVHDNETRLRNAVYNVLRQLDEQRGNTWVFEIRSMLFVFGFGHVWHQHSVGNTVMFLSELKQRLIDTAVQNWHSDVITNHKLNMYSLYKSTLEIETYLKINMYWKHRTALARFRCVNHKLAI